MSHRHFIPPSKPMHLWVLMALAACTHTHIAHAVSLGKFELKSDRGQALSAELEIVAAKEDELRTLKIGVAPAQTYRQHWLELHPEIVGTKFILKRNAQGRHVVQIQGTEPIVRPWLDLLLVVTWNDQQRIHEYSVRFPSADSTPDLTTALAKLPPMSKLPDPTTNTAGRIETEAPKQQEVADAVQASGIAARASTSTGAMAAAVSQAKEALPDEGESKSTSVDLVSSEPEGNPTGTANSAVQDVPFSDPAAPVTGGQTSSLDDMVRIFTATSRSDVSPPATTEMAEMAENAGGNRSSEEATNKSSETSKVEQTPTVEIDKETFATYKQLLANNTLPENTDSESAQQLQGKIRIETKRRAGQSSRLALSSPADQKIAALALREQELENAAIVSSMQKNIDDIKNLQTQASSDLGAAPAQQPSDTPPALPGTSYGASSMDSTASPVPNTNPSSDQPTPIVSSGIPNDGGMFGRFKSEIKSVLFAAFIVFIPIFFLFKSAQSTDQTRKKKSAPDEKSRFQSLKSALRFGRQREEDAQFKGRQKHTSPSTKIPTVTDRVGGLDLNLDTPSGGSQSSKAP